MNNVSSLATPDETALEAASTITPLSGSTMLTPARHLRWRLHTIRDLLKRANGGETVADGSVTPRVRPIAPQVPAELREFFDAMNEDMNEVEAEAMLAKSRAINQQDVLDLMRG